MDSPARPDFIERLQRIVEAYEERDGPDRRRRLSRRRLVTGLRAIALPLIGVVWIKGLLILELGPGAYAQHLALLTQGDAMSRLGAVVMAPDAASAALAQGLGRIAAATRPAVP